MNYTNRDFGINRIRARKNYCCYGMGLGIIILDDVYPGFPGDVRNASTYPYPIQYEIVEGVDIETLVFKEDKSPCLELIKKAAKRLERMGFKLGVWTAPFAISEFSDMATQHPEWLLGGEKGDPLPTGEWFWEPHGKIYALDLTHPGARSWLGESIRSLSNRGVRYLKADFLAIASGSNLRHRHDRRVVAGGGSEAMRMGLEIMRSEMQAPDPGALLLNCSGPEMPGTGAFPLLYVCNDTGNTGYVGWAHHRRNYGLNLAGHLFKHGRWGIIQPSCLCVGPPGTLEEA